MIQELTELRKSHQSCIYVLGETANLEKWLFESWRFEVFKSINCRKQFVIYCMMEGKIAWCLRSAVRPLRSLPGLFGLSANWDTFWFCISQFIFLLVLRYDSSHFYGVRLGTSCRLIRRNGLKPYRASSTPFVAFLRVLTCGRSLKIIFFSYILIL